MNTCKKCGNKLSSNQKFCHNCGETNDEYQEEIETTNIKTKKIWQDKKKVIIIGAVIIIAIIIIVAVVNGDNSDKEVAKKGVNLKKIYENIEGDDYYATLATDNSYIKIDTNPLDTEEYFSSVAWEMIEEINDELDLPDSLEEKMGETRALDGRITEKFDDVTVSWTYHPDTGLEVMYEKN